ncbi:MAG: 2-amino-4-hydroxy-6-hydroxymethyldihydropteridine diphosphokinase [Desulfobulbaceae bacterium S3730MH12]|nr:MAG: 2-amino-4-hydroxy-6-hydroxymethyldihydropteridine diphosphokinase [Desulfobulbaceae bacterium S5133MH15]OEU56465.1 MAG: 2-amino-4-hydroxy-6-hydroxymethyldihydropteridine diphosphokinase [Desulfobulbaceae bacterium S3730MH12]
MDENLTVDTGDVFVALGSNLGDSAHTLLKAWTLLGEHEGIALTALSPPFITAPIDMTSQHWFTNAAGCLSTRHPPHALLDILLETEAILGRVRDGDNNGYQDRNIDLDLLYFGSAVLEDLRLTLPHPRRDERLFVLAPMAAIAPEFVDPGHLQTIAEMHHQLLEKIRNNQIVNQEIKVGLWPEKS